MHHAALTCGLWPNAPGPICVAGHIAAPMHPVLDLSGPSHQPQQAYQLPPLRRQSGASRLHDLLGNLSLRQQSVPRRHPALDHLLTPQYHEHQEWLGPSTPACGARVRYKVSPSQLPHTARHMPMRVNCSLCGASLAASGSSSRRKRHSSTRPGVFAPPCRAGAPCPGVGAPMWQRTAAKRYRQERRAG
jgi:hypothetical protein